MLYGHMKRIFDLTICLLLGPVIFAVILLISLVMILTSGFPVFFWSDRVGRHNKIFKMVKFRTMRSDTPNVATHLLEDPEKWLTPTGKFLRKTSLDELPQILNILIGDMSFVGPRPALYNQEDLIQARTSENIDRLRPGLTGWAQINGRDELSIEEKVLFDKEYLNRFSLTLDLKIILMTFLSVVRFKGVKH